MKTEQLLSQQAYQQIKNDIVTCALEPGQHIAQSSLAARYQVGITPIREALRQLAQEGFVSPIPRMGYMVSFITAQDVHEIYEMRALLETSAVRFAAARAGADELDALLELANFTYIYKDRASYRDFLDRNAAFHRQIAHISANRRLEEQVSRCLDELNRVFHLGLDIRDSTEEMRSDHLALAAALHQRNADEAVRLIMVEIDRSQSRVLEALRHFPGAGNSTPHRIGLSAPADGI